jgi:hypothetical protein
VGEKNRQRVQLDPAKDQELKFGGKLRPDHLDQLGLSDTAAERVQQEEFAEALVFQSVDRLEGDLC